MLCMMLSLVIVQSLAARADGNGGSSPNGSVSVTKSDLSEDEQKRLSKDKVLVSRQEVKQCFTAYMDGSYPRFVTSDAVLNAYHVLFEETLKQQEEFQSRHLRTLCQDMWRLLATAERMYRGYAEKIAAAKKQAQFVIGVALCLQGNEFGACETDLKEAIKTEAAAVEKAEGRHKPSWLGEPEPDFVALDYTLFRPVGFYADSTSLQRYFRALRWLQVVPFRLKRDEELLTFHMMGMVMQSPWAYGQGMKDAKLLPEGLDMATHERLYQALNHRKRFAMSFGLAIDESDLCEPVLSRPDEVPVTVDAAFFTKHVEDLTRRQNAARVIGSDRIRTTLPEKAEREFRMLSAFRLPEDEAMTFLGRSQRVSWPQKSPGLEFAAWLGLPLAEKLLGKETVADLVPLRPEVEIYSNTKLEPLAWWQRVVEGYGDMGLMYRAALRVLAEVDKRAPEFMHGDAWQMKTLQTVAASWAQERHAWMLQTKPEAHVLSAAPYEKGFVEPVPEFFRLLGDVAGRMGNLAFEAEVNNDPVTPVIEDLQAESRWLRDNASKNPSKNDIFDGIWSANESLADYHGFGSGIDPESAKPEDLIKVADLIDALRTEMERDARPGTPLWERIQNKRIHTVRLWHQLEILCMRLSMLAEKQLQKVPLSEEDGRLIESIGYILSEIMMYRGQAMIFPVDDAPRVARICSDPRTGEILHAAIGRPRLMFVLYPWEGREVLCRGVVMPYHEIRDGKTLTDDEWRKRQDGNSRIGIPEWLRSMVPTGNITVKARH